MYFFSKIYNSPFNVVFVPVTPERYLQGVPFANDTDIAFEVTFGTSRDIIRVRQQSPFVIKVMICTK